MRLLDNVESPRWRCNSCTPFSRTFRNYCIILTHILIISAKLNRGFRFQDHFGFCNNSAKFTDVCESGRVPPIPPQTMNTTMYDNSRCYCDSACMEYGDCCPDLVNLKDTRLLREMERRSKWSCHDLLVNTYYRPPGAYMIGSCPPHYGVESIIKRCKKEVSTEDYHYSLDFQVLSNATNITYVNVYCAECNGENLTHLHSWNVEIYCQKTQSDCMDNIHLWQYIPGERMWTFRGYSITYVIKDYVDDYYKTYGARRCRQGIVDQCPEHWSGTEERLLCASHALHVMSSEDKRVYKNKYCAACHHRTTNLTCPYYVLDDGTVKSDPSQLFSYARLLSFHKKENDQLCDSLQNVCVNYVCGINFYKDESGQCVSKSQMSNQGLKDSCPKVFVPEDEFVWLQNGSIYLNSTNQIYSPKEYENATNSTVLICADDSLILWKFSRTQAILSTICATLSLVCLAAHIAVHLVISQLRNLPGKILLCLSAALFVGQLCFEIQGFFNKNFQLCLTVAVIMHYSFLSSFFWMNVMAIDVYYAFSNKTSFGITRTTSRKQFLKYSIYAWSTPAIIVILSLFNDFFEYIQKIKPTYHNPLGACWINNQWALLVFFVAPVAIVILENIFFFTMTVVGISRTSKIAKKVTRSKAAPCDLNIHLILIYTKLAVIMGLTWVFGFIAMLMEIEFLWYLFIICNALQGAFIFMAFTCKPKVYQQLKFVWSKDTITTTETKSTPPSTPLTLSTPLRFLAQSFRKTTNTLNEDVKL